MTTLTSHAGSSAVKTARAVTGFARCFGEQASASGPSQPDGGCAAVSHPGGAAAAKVASPERSAARGLGHLHRTGAVHPGPAVVPDRAGIGVPAPCPGRASGIGIP